jgi:hypothetical protein
MPNIDVYLGTALTIVLAIMAEIADEQRYPKWKKGLWGSFFVLVIVLAYFQVRSRQTETQQHVKELTERKSENADLRATVLKGQELSVLLMSQLQDIRREVAKSGDVADVRKRLSSAEGITGNLSKLYAQGTATDHNGPEALSNVELVYRARRVVDGLQKRMKQKQEMDDDFERQMAGTSAQERAAVVARRNKSREQFFNEEPYEYLATEALYLQSLMLIRTGQRPHNLGEFGGGNAQPEMPILNLYFLSGKVPLI